MHYAIFFGGMVVGTLFGLLLAGLLGMAGARDRTMKQWQRLQRDYPMLGKEEIQ